LTKVIIVYETRYGNTKKVAEKISEGLRTRTSIQVDAKNLKDIDEKDVPKYDVILVGSPNHMGGPTRGIKKFIDKLSKLNLKGKQFAAFDTCSPKDLEKAVKKMEKSLAEKIPGIKIIPPSLSVIVLGMKGPISEEELTKSVEYGKKLATKLS